jgi:hypothetical protein
MHLATRAPWLDLSISVLSGDCAIEDVFVGLYYQNQANLRADFDAVTSGKMRSPSRREIDAELSSMSDGELWEGSNGPVFVGEQKGDLDQPI